MRCPQCNRWPTIEQADPEVEVELNNDHITGTVRISLICAECGAELKQHDFDVDIDVSEKLAEHKCPNEDMGVGWSVDATAENTSRQHPPNRKVKKTFYGFDLVATLQCNCDEVKEEYLHSAEIQSSHMEKLV